MKRSILLSGLLFSTQVLALPPGTNSMIKDLLAGKSADFNTLLAKHTLTALKVEGVHYKDPAFAETILPCAGMSRSAAGVVVTLTEEKDSGPDAVYTGEHKFFFATMGSGPMRLCGH